MRFNYEGFNAFAQVRHGFVDAKDVGDAAEILRGHGLNVQNLKPESDGTLRRVLEGGEDVNFPADATPAPADFRPWDYAKEKDRSAPEANPSATVVEVKPDDKDYKWKNDVKREVEAGLAKRTAALEVLQYVREVGVPHYANTDSLLGMIEEEIREKLVATINRAIKERTKQ